MEKYLKENSNLIQWKLIQFLRPIAKNHAPRVMQGFLGIWRETMDPTNLVEIKDDSKPNVQAIKAQLM